MAGHKRKSLSEKDTETSGLHSGMLTPGALGAPWPCLESTPSLPDYRAWHGIPHTTTPHTQGSGDWVRQFHELTAHSSSAEDSERNS